MLKSKVTGKRLMRAIEKEYETSIEAAQKKGTS
jgi:hypothetical protein